MNKATKRTMAHRIGSHLPCSYTEIDKRSGMPKTSYPLVDCEYDCAVCGWNPKVKKARLKEMGFLPGRSGGR